MVDRARSCGLALQLETPVDRDPLGPLHDTRTGVYRVIPPFVRQIGVTDKASEFVASSAVDRHKQFEDYAPAGLLTYLDGEPQIMPA
jgi:hypothetical protein